ncbi:MAG: hypothetical protein JXQ93_07920 [Flavobacteriaceae bacterium]
MKRKLTFPFLLLSFVFSTLSAQGTQSTIDSSYVKYFQDSREIPYLHLNKTTFIKGEEIWFQAYILEQNSRKPHPITSNLYVSIFDNHGKLKDQQLIHINEGKGYGSIHIDSTFTKNHYYLKASTKWMQNFNEVHSFSQKISVLSNEKRTKTNTLLEKHFFEFQVFPESGYLVESIENRLGILIKNRENIGQKIAKGILKKRSGEIVREFSTNSMGLGSVYFYYDKGENYTLEATLENGSIITQELPSGKQKGIVMHIDNPNTQYLKVMLSTNAATINHIKNKQYKVWIHNTNTYYKNAISFQKNETVKALYVRNDKLAKGINIITVFNEHNKPILERLFFNYDKSTFTKPKISSTAIKGDSLVTTITNTSDERMHLSASFLPETTKAYKPSNTIYSSFLLKPYIKGDIQNPAYYFKDINRKKLKDLDLLLLTQGWSKYRWDHIFANPPTTNFNFERGIDITIKLNNPLRKRQSVLVHSRGNHIIREIKPKENPYIIKNTYIKKNSELNFALKYGGKFLKVAPILSYSNSSFSESFNLNNIDTLKATELEISNFKTLSKDVEVLDEVVVKSAKRKYDNEVRGAASMLRLVKAEDLIVPTNSLVEYVRSVRLQYSYSMRPLSQVFLNNDLVRSPSLLYNIDMSEVREVAYGVSIMGSRQLHIYTYSPREYYKEKIQFSKVKLPVGFASEKEYYDPKYPSFVDDTYKYYGAIFWEPNITIAPNSSIKITVSKHFQSNINVYVEGITKGGKLVSNKYKIK